MTRRLVLAMTIVAGLVAVALAIPLAISAGSDVRDDLIARLEVQTVWDPVWIGTGKTLDVHIASLRKKLGDPELIETVRGVGYRLAETDA